MKHIQSVSSLGIEYIDDNGTLQFIDFNACYQNYLEMSYGTQPTEEDLERESSFLKCVGQRDLYSNPPYIELFTVPLTRFEFTSKDDYYELRRKIIKAKWRTRDLG